LAKAPADNGNLAPVTPAPGCWFCEPSMQAEMPHHEKQLAARARNYAPNLVLTPSVKFN
jgi:hypothetical protein